MFLKRFKAYSIAFQELVEKSVGIKIRFMVFF